jgi:MEKHLA domain
MMVQPWTQPNIVGHTQNLLRSFRHWFGRELWIGSNEPQTIAEALFCAPIAVLSHGTQVDPILNYGNQTALQLWEMDWADFTQMPSRLTAEPDLREGRSQLLAAAAQQGYLTDYSGVRISKTGQRFWIEQAIIWRVLDDEGNNCGQAATFDRWKPLT